MHSNLKRLIIIDIRVNELKTSLFVLIFCFIIPFIFSINPNSMVQAAMPGELLMPLVAIFCFGSLFLPEQTANIVSVINSKTRQLQTIYIIRFIWYMILLILVNSGIILTYSLSSTQYNLLLLWFDFCVKSFFIGSMIILIYSLSRAIAASYLIPTLYFALCIGYPHLGMMTLLTIMHRQGWSGNWLQFCLGTLFLLMGFVILKYQPAKA
ncbi:MAG: ABC transporter permease [Lentilactobacillus buchneri]|nr:ABC transporter permease [Lentilactobacillus buchneri]MCI1950736.1 ABC transporter permease [Lentilactobacillus buchneri]MCI2018189.1 ABC transporter permease [Lentilactobacillus buchneri]MCI2027862.1 ABC transporter permease [Lentilactobacillus buchneri]